MPEYLFIALLFYSVYIYKHIGFRLFHLEFVSVPLLSCMKHRNSRPLIWPHGVFLDVFFSRYFLTYRCYSYNIGENHSEYANRHFYVSPLTGPQHIDKA